MNPITKKLLYSRSSKYDFNINEFLNNNIYDLHNINQIPNINNVKKLISEHISWNNKIIIASDFDVDGVTSAAVMYKTLNRLDANVEVMVGDRFKYNYGLSKQFIDDINNNGANLIITLDMGISNNIEIEYAKSLGIDVIVIDHHERDSPPDCLYIDLKVRKDIYPFRNLSACGITWKVCQYILEDDLNSMLDIVTLSTIADMVPLLNENRIIVKEGLKKLNNTNNIGLKELIKKLELNNKKISTGHVGFQIAPCINAHHRLKGSNQISFELLTTDNVNRAKEISEQLIKLNELRKKETEKGMEIAEKQMDLSKNIIIQKLNISKGIAGLIASDLQEKYEKPAFIFNNKLSGSLRSYKPLTTDIILKNIKHLLISGGGHSIVMGARLKENKFNEFKNILYDLSKGLKYKTLKYDFELDIKKISLNIIKELNSLSPFGIGFPKPKFKYKVKKTKNIKIIKNQHIKFNIKKLECIGFYKINKLDIIKNGNFNIVYSPNINNWNGKKNIQLIIKKIKGIN